MRIPIKSWEKRKIVWKTNNEKPNYTTYWKENACGISNFLWPRIFRCFLSLFDWSERDGNPGINTILEIMMNCNLWPPEKTDRLRDCLYLIGLVWNLWFGIFNALEMCSDTLWFMYYFVIRVRAWFSDFVYQLLEVRLADFEAECFLVELTKSALFWKFHLCRWRTLILGHCCVMWVTNI